ncbi:MAG: serine hydrolase domain-containing protein [Rhizomicrobium sp.]
MPDRANSLGRRHFVAVSSAAVFLLNSRAVFGAAASSTSGLELIAATAEKAGFNGSVFIANRGNALMDGAYGWTSPARQERVNKGTLFNIASVTKAFTATAVLKLAERNKLRLTTTLVDIFPDVPADKRGISIEELLTHTSGLPKGYAANGCRTRDAAVKAIFALPLANAPGAHFEYTDDGYALLAAIVENAGGETYNDFVRNIIFRSAGMRETKFWNEVDDRKDKNVARIVTLPIEERYRGMNWGYIGSGGIWSTAEDLARFFYALRAGLILDPGFVDEMMKPRVKVSVGAAGFGWYVGESSAGTPLIFARGNEDWGHSALIFWYPDRSILMTIVTNSGFQDDTPISRVLAGKLESALLALPT